MSRKASHFTFDRPAGSPIRSPRPVDVRVRPTFRSESVVAEDAKGWPTRLRGGAWKAWGSRTAGTRGSSSLVIVLLVFPTLLLTLMQPWKLVIYGLAWLLPGDKLWAQWIGWCAVVIGMLLALFGVSWICRQIWPTATTKAHG